MEENTLSAETAAAKVRSESNKIVERIIEALGRGEIPWKKPWRSSPAYNAITKNEYRGINSICLNLASHYSDPRFLTYRQAAAIGAQVRKGEKGWPVIFYSTATRKNEDNGETTNGEKSKTFRFMKFYTVFNASQCDNMPELTEGEKAKPVETLTSAEEVIRKMPKAPKILNEGRQAAYSPSKDVVYMPPVTAHWTGTQEYYSTMFHELTHSTGHESRLNRDLSGFFGSDNYSREELVAEIGAQFLCQSTGINTPAVEENAVAYCQNWSKVLRADPKIIFYAAAKAQAAHDFIMGRGKA